MKAAAYLRVSTDRQDELNQEPAVLQMIAARGLELVRVYREQESSAKDRPVLTECMDAARRGEFDILTVWSLDRFGRTMWTTIDQVRELDRIGVRFLSVKESWFDSTGPVRDLLLPIFAWVANQERNRIRERVRAGMDRAKEQGTKSGKPIGRPAFALEPWQKIQIESDRAFGMSWRAISKKTGWPESTIRKAMR